MRPNTTSLVQVHVAVLLFGMAGLFAEWVAQSAWIIVLGRVFFGTLALGAILLYRRESIRLHTRTDALRLLLTGVILAVHWTTFFQSIQVANVAVGLIAYSTFPMFVTFLEPLMLKTRLRLIDIAIALVTVIGAVLVVPSFTLENQITQGFLWGVVSALTFALLSIFNKWNVERYSSLVVAFYQDAAAAVMLLPAFFLNTTPITTTDWGLLVLLGVIFTALAHTLYIQGLSGIRAWVAGIIASLESVYGIVFALVIFAQVPSLRTLLGGAIILGAALYSSLQDDLPSAASTN